MKSVNKQYLLYLFKRHKTLIAIYTVILFVVLTLFGLSLQMQSYGDEMMVIKFIRVTSSLIGMGLSVIIPIYSMSFLYKKNSGDMYFALPCQKENLWREQMIFQYLVVAIPLLMIIIITYFAILMGGVVCGFHDLIWLLLLLIFMILQQAISSLVCIKCNNMIDAIVATIAYFMIPIALLGTVMIFLNTHIIYAMLGSGYSINELPIYSFLTYIISPFINIMVTALSDSTLPIEAIISDLIWIIIGMIIIKYMYKSFKNRKGEDNETNTKSFIIYPLMIFAVVFMMIINITSLKDTFTFFMITAMSVIVFILLICFANRKIAIKPQYLLAFAIIYTSTLGFGYVFDATNCFNMIHEIPNVDNKRISKMYFDIKDGSYYTTYIYISGSDPLIDLEHLKEAHKKAIDRLKEEEYSTNRSYDMSNIRIRYVMSNGDEYQRYYCVPLLTRTKINNMLNDNHINYESRNY